MQRRVRTSACARETKLITKKITLTDTSHTIRDETPLYLICAKFGRSSEQNDVINRVNVAPTVRGYICRRPKIAFSYTQHNSCLICFTVCQTVRRKCPAERVSECPRRGLTDTPTNSRHINGLTVQRTTHSCKRNIMR